MNDFVLPVLKQYCNAVLQEMYYLRDNGGRQYRVVNGKKNSSKNGFYIYDFEVESELYLSDDAPVSLAVSNEKVEGIVFSCDGFQISVGRYSIYIVTTMDLN